MAKDLVKLRKKAGELALKGKLDKALKIYQEIVQDDPKDIKTWVKIGDLYKKMGRGEQAIEIYSKASASYAVGGYLMQAISVNKMILEIDPDHADTQGALASLYAEKEGGETAASDGGTSGTAGASSSVLDMLKKKGSGTPAVSMPKAEKPKPAPKPEPAETTPEPEEIEIETEIVEDVPEVVAEDITEEVAEEVPEVAPETASAESPAFPQFDAVDIEMADDLFDQIMNQDVVELETGDDADKILSKLPSIPLFSSLNQGEFLGIVEKLNLRRFDVGDKIIKEGDEGTAFYIVASGAAKITKTDTKGKEVTVAKLGEGDFFGEFSFFSESARAASVTVTAEMEALEIDREELAELTQQFPRIVEVMREFYKQRLIGTMLRISPFFQPLSDEDQATIKEKFESLDAKLGDVLIQQGTEGQGLFVIASGEISVTVKDEAGKPIEVARLSEGSFFGEISLITDSPTTANCIAVKESLLFKLPRATFKALIAEFPQILEVTADYADQRVKSTKKMIAGGDALQKAGIV